MRSYCTLYMGWDSNEACSTKNRGRVRVEATQLLRPSSWEWVRLLLFFKSNLLKYQVFSPFLKMKCTHQTMISLNRSENAYIRVRISAQYHFYLDRQNKMSDKTYIFNYSALYLTSFFKSSLRILFSYFLILKPRGKVKGRCLISTY